MIVKMMKTIAIVTNLSCPNCGAFHLVYWGHKDKEDIRTQRMVKRKTKENEVKAHKILFNDDKEPEMWEHYCEEEKTEMAVGKGEPCNWCGKEEEDCESCS